MVYQNSKYMNLIFIFFLQHFDTDSWSFKKIVAKVYLTSAISQFCFRAMSVLIIFAKRALREKCPNTEFFLVRIQSKHGKIRTRHDPLFRLFSRGGGVQVFVLTRSPPSRFTELKFSSNLTFLIYRLPPVQNDHFSKCVI